MGLFRRARGDCPTCGREARKDLGEKREKENSVTVTCKKCGTTFNVPVLSDWWFSYRDPAGRFRRKKHGPDKKSAGLCLKKVEVEVAEGKYIDRKATCKVTLGELLDRRLEFIKPRRKPLNYAREQSARKRLVEVLGAGTRIDRITEAVVEDYQHGREGAAEATIIRELHILSGALSWAVRKGWITKKPTFRLGTPKNGRERFLSREEARRLVGACGPDVRLFVRLALGTGMRRGELLHMTWPWVDLRRNQINIPGAATKSGDPRTVPISPSTREALLEARDGSARGCPLVLHWGGRPIDGSVLWRKWKKAARAAGLDGLRIHDLRHSCASFLVARGVSLYEVATILGHKDLKVTQRYAHLHPDHLAAAMQHVDFDRPADPPEITENVVPFPSARKTGE